MARSAVISVATRRFWNLFSALPPDIQRLAILSIISCGDVSLIHLLYASIEWKATRIGFSIRVGDHYRSPGELRAETIGWVWIGTHSEYNRLVGS
jgi:hypothetical protein